MSLVGNDTKGYTEPMSTTIQILMILAMGLTVAALGAGLTTLLRGGKYQIRWSNKFMRYRIAFQAIAIIIFVILVMFARGSGPGGG